MHRPLTRLSPRCAEESTHRRIRARHTGPTWRTTSLPCGRAPASTGLLQHDQPRARSAVRPRVAMAQSCMKASSNSATPHRLVLRRTARRRSRLGRFARRNPATVGTVSGSSLSPAVRLCGSPTVTLAAVICRFLRRVLPAAAPGHGYPGLARTIPSQQPRCKPVHFSAPRSTKHPRGELAMHVGAPPCVASDSFPLCATLTPPVEHSRAVSAVEREPRGR
jgi:hypothetical protein